MLLLLLLQLQQQQLVQLQQQQLVQLQQVVQLQQQRHCCPQSSNLRPVRSGGS
jgi:hypothetical protein